jgi:hypothetical protein
MAQEKLNERIAHTVEQLKKRKFPFVSLSDRDKAYIAFYEGFAKLNEDSRITLEEILTSGRRPAYGDNNDKPDDVGVISRLEKAGYLTLDSDLTAFTFVDKARSTDSLFDDIAEIQSDQSLKETDRETLILARIGQGRFREKLVSLWQGCAVTGCRRIEVLRASHIKAWKHCASHTERLDAFNGLLLIPNLDALFDKALISFDVKGQIQISKRLSKED